MKMINLTIRAMVLIELAVLLFILAIILTGCARIQGSRTLPDGTHLTITATRILWQSQGIEFSTKDASGVEVTLRVKTSNTDAEAIAALADIAKSAAMPR